MKMTQVVIANMKFTPATVSVKAGECVIWCNSDTKPHTVTDDTGKECSGAIAPGTSYHREFKEVGEFPYHCEYHPMMKGTVTVSIHYGEPEAPAKDPEEPVKKEAPVVPVKAPQPVHHEEAAAHADPAEKELKTPRKAR